MLNCMPNRQGLMDTSTVELLNEIGDLWVPNNKRPLIDAKIDRVVYSVPIVKATTSSGEAENLIDAMQYKTDFKHWIAENDDNQTIVLDLGYEYSNINVVTIVPNHKSKPYPETSLKEGAILYCTTYVSANGIDFKQVSSNIWGVNSNYRTIEFPKTNTRYIKIEISKVNGKSAIIAEIEVGSSIVKPEKL